MTGHSLGTVWEENTLIWNSILTQCDRAQPRDSLGGKHSDMEIFNCIEHIHVWGNLKVGPKFP